MSVSTRMKRLMQPGLGEKFEDAVEAGIKYAKKKIIETYTFAKNNKKVSIGIVAGSALTLGLIFYGIPAMVNSYHSNVAESELSTAKSQINLLVEASNYNVSQLNTNRFIIPDGKEALLDQEIKKTTGNIETWLGDISEADQLYANEEYLAARNILEGSEGRGGIIGIVEDFFKKDDSNAVPGVLYLIENEFSATDGVKIYITTLRASRDKVLSNESSLASIMSPIDSGYDTPLDNNFSVRLDEKSPTLERIITIARRQGVKDKATGIWNNAQTNYTQAFVLYTDGTFIHYSTSLDNTLDQTDYDRILQKQSNVFSSIQYGDSDLASLVDYLGYLETETYTIVVNRRTDYYMHDNWVQVANPAYSEHWDPNINCSPDYDTQTYESCTTDDTGTTCVEYDVQVQVGETCSGGMVDNGQPRTVPENQKYRVDQYFVKVEEHACNISGQDILTGSPETDVESQSAYDLYENQTGYVTWKPFGDDITYSGIPPAGMPDYQTTMTCSPRP